MPIQFPCPSCNNILQVPDSAAGKAAKCKGCGNTAPIPAASTVGLNALPPAPSFPAQPDGSYPTNIGPAQQNMQPGFGQQNMQPGFGPQPGQPGFGQQSGYPQQPGYPMPQSHQQPMTSGVNWKKAGIGILMMVGAVVWFVGGLAADRIFFYPPILLIFGFIAFIRGLMGGQ